LDRRKGILRGRWPLIHGSPGRFISIGWETKRHRVWECWEISLTRGVVSPSETAFWYKQLIPPTTDYAFPVLRSASRTRIRKLQVLQTKCLRNATSAHWYNDDSQIHEDLEVPFFADHVISLTGRFELKLADVENPLVTQLGRYLRRRPGSTNMSWLPVRRWPCRHTETCPSGTLDYPDLCFFPCFFPQLKSKWRGNTQRQGTTRKFPWHDDFTGVPDLRRH